MLSIEKPTLLLDKDKVLRNIEGMSRKARSFGVTLRPHFKTHQSAEVGEWFRPYGVDRITVSSIDMAAYFADAGWDDITIAFPVNVRQMNRLNELASRVRLNLLVESLETAARLENEIAHSVGVWLKVNAGYHRTGIPWTDIDFTLQVADKVASSRRLELQGLLTHAGHTYSAAAPSQVRSIYLEVLDRLQMVQGRLKDAGLPHKLSVGDTPGCSVMESFGGVDEIRPGNFVFYDLMQLNIGACREEDIAVAVACPVVAKHVARRQLILYGGAIHLSKEHLALPGGGASYGKVARWAENSWTQCDSTSEVISLSQEHGIVQASDELFRYSEVGDLLVVLPVHSCLTANLYSNYLTTDGDQIPIARLQ